MCETTWKRCESRWADSRDGYAALVRLACLIDTEGSIFLSRTRSAQPDGYEARLSMSMSCERTVRWAASAIERLADRAVRVRRWKTAIGTPMWQIVLGGRRAALVIAQLLPWLVTKQERALWLMAREHHRMLARVLDDDSRISLRPYLALVGDWACWSTTGASAQRHRASMDDATREALR